MPTCGFAIENHIFDPAETLPRTELEALQLSRLRGLVERVAHVPFYGDYLALHNIIPQGIRSLDDLRRLPFTTKADLRLHQPLGFLAVPRQEVARMPLARSLPLRAHHDPHEPCRRAQR